MADIFISYARTDREFVRRLSRMLEEHGLSVWWDRQLMGGAEFSAEIERELEAAHSVIVVWSAASAASRWVRDEAGAAADAGKLVAISIDGMMPPIGFRQLHSIDFQGDEDTAMADLLRSVALRDADQPASQQVTSSNLENGPKKSRKMVFAAILLVVVTIIGAALWLPRPSTEEQSVEGLSMALQTIDREKSVAVRPFEIISGDSENSWFATALTGEITSTLGRIPDVIVAQQGDVAALTGMASAEVASELGVANVLEGTILETGDKLRVSVSLADAEGRQIWAETYDRPTTDLIEIHEEIAAKVAEVLGSLLDPEKLTEFVNLGTKSFEAYQHVAQVPAQAFTNWDDYNLALEGYRKAYAADPAFARAHLRAAVLHLETISPGPMESWNDKSDAITERWPAFLEELKRGRELARLEDDIAYGRFMHAMGFGNIGAMRAALTDQLTTNPTRTGAIWSLVHVNNMVGKSDENAPLVEAFIQLAPDRVASATHLAWESGMKDKALELAEKILLESASEQSLHEAFDAFVYMGELDRAEAVLSKHNAMTSDPDHAARTSAYLSCARGDREPLLKILEETDDRGQLYVLHMMLGNTKEANALLQKYDRAKPPYPLMWQAWSGAIDVTQFPNFRNLIERDGLEPTEMRLVAHCPA